MISNKCVLLKKALPNKIVQQPLNQTITVSSNYSSSRTRQCPLNG